MVNSVIYLIGYSYPILLLELMVFNAIRVSGNDLRGIEYFFAGVNAVVVLLVIKESKKRVSLFTKVVIVLTVVALTFVIKGII